jgi:integrase
MDNGYKQSGNMVYLFGRGKEMGNASEDLDNRKLEGALILSDGKDGRKLKIERRQYLIAGKKVYISGSSEQDVAEQYAQLMLKSMEPVKTSPRDHRKTVRTDFCDYADKWFTFKTGRSKISARTAVNYKGHLNQIKEYFKGKSVEEIDRKVIQAFLDVFQHQSQSTTRHKRIVLQQIFKWAVEDELISVNPAIGDRIEVIGKQKVKRSAVPEELYRKLLDNLKCIKRREDRALLALVACTGMRRGEALALRWEDIDWTHNLIRINKAVTFIGNQPHIKGPKSEKGNRNVPMLPQLAEILMPMNRQTGYVVSQDGEPFTDTMVKNSLHRIQVQADMQGHTFHSLRHSYATMLAKNPGIAPKTLQSLMGHADISTTFNMYAETENCTMAEAGCLFTQQLAQ